MDVPELAEIETDNTLKIGRKSARRPRVELITRSERRRRWSIEQKQGIVAESLRSDTTPTKVARKYAISSGLLYWPSDREAVRFGRAADRSESVANPV